MVVALEFTMQFRLLSGLHTTGDRVELWTDKALALDWHTGRKPIVPATSLKGWLREGAERILRAVGRPACDGCQPSSICGNCLVCEFFGHPRAKAKLVFEDGKLESERRATRTSVSLSPYRKTAYEERLFTTEVAWGQILTVQGKGFFATHEEAKRAAALLWLVAKAGFALGGARSRGLGWLELIAFSARCDGQEIAGEEIQGVAEALVRG
ncbi:MAG: RAMP superfamily CRISPR-associated protein [Armatimonadota bacterium]|nr:RAMP superfamily CRISPR-associated protein [Armatimonadota bacterium]